MSRKVNVGDKLLVYGSGRVGRVFIVSKVTPSGMFDAHEARFQSGKIRFSASGRSGQGYRGMRVSWPATPEQIEAVERLAEFQVARGRISIVMHHIHVTAGVSAKVVEDMKAAAVLLEGVLKALEGRE